MALASCDTKDPYLARGAIQPVTRCAAGAGTTPPAAAATTGTTRRRRVVVVVCCRLRHLQPRPSSVIDPAWGTTPAGHIIIAAATAGGHAHRLARHGAARPSRHARSPPAARPRTVEAISYQLVVAAPPR